ncbi:MAG TPA: OmpA family protein [Chitinophagaceae bacterium]|jgi:hypothetical protein|nr:OmpA family protein [Chitinophagaceae bacterium]
MHKLILFSGAFLCAQLSIAQKTDTLTILYKTGQYSISKQDKQKLDSFLRLGWDKLSINGYTDETDEEGYNLELSKRRSGEVYKYFLAKNITDNTINPHYFGESMPKGDNDSDEGRALNRRTEIIGYRFPRITVKPKDPAADPMTPVTRTLDNGFIITYRPGTLPGYMADNFESGSGSNFKLITNTVEMRQNNLYNNTTRGEILSSVLIICGERLDPCKLDSPILVKVPIPFKTKCPLEKVKFFNTVAENGKLIWQEQTKLLYPEMIGGQQYVRLWIDDFCNCINFDFKIDPECFDTDSTKFMYVNAGVKNLTAELKGLNSVYMPRRINDTTHTLLYQKDKIGDAVLSFSLYNGKRRIRGFRDKVITKFPYDKATQQYILATGTRRLYFPRLNVWSVVLNVNGDRYRAPGDKHCYDFIYLKQETDSILVDFTVVESKKTVTVYKDQLLSSIPYDSLRQQYVIDRNFVRVLKQKEREKEKTKTIAAK